MPEYVIQPTLCRVPTGAQVQLKTLSCQLHSVCVPLKPFDVGIMLPTYLSLFVDVKRSYSVFAADRSPQPTAHSLSGLPWLPRSRCYKSQRIAHALIGT